MNKHYSSIISNMFGAFAAHGFARPVQKLINHGYVKLMGLDMAEFEAPASYDTLNKLFTRGFRIERPIEADKDVVISPVDGLITDFGDIKAGRAYQIKGMDYDLGELLGPHHQSAAEALEGGTFVNLYLSPKDYHRYHAPQDLAIKSLTHIPGKLYPVNFPLLRHKKNLFIENERVVIECETGAGELYVMVLVGALNVGRMIVSFEAGVKTNTDITEPQHYQYTDKQLERGELFGWFEMGSTILLFSPKGTFAPDLTLNQKLKFADLIGRGLYP